jgi:hypothetical protein
MIHFHYHVAIVSGATGRGWHQSIMGQLEAWGLDLGGDDGTTRVHTVVLGVPFSFRAGPPSMQATCPGQAL